MWRPHPLNYYNVLRKRSLLQQYSGDHSVSNHRIFDIQFLHLVIVQYQVKKFYYLHVSHSQSMLRSINKRSTCTTYIILYIFNLLYAEHC